MVPAGRQYPIPVPSVRRLVPRGAMRVCSDAYCATCPRHGQGCSYEGGRKMRIFATAAIAALSLTVFTQAGAQTPVLKGDQQRSYNFAAAGRDMPYRLVVPQTYDATQGAPLVVALHGFG